MKINAPQSVLTRIIALILILAGVWLFMDQLGRPQETADRGLAGLDFTIPPGYTRLDFGEGTYMVIAQRLLEELDSKSKVAAVFTLSGDQIQVLVNQDDKVIQEHIYGKSGVLRYVQWKGLVRDRLRWATEHGDFSVPGMPPPETRNAYH